MQPAITGAIFQKRFICHPKFFKRYSIVKDFIIEIKYKAFFYEFIKF